VQDSTVPDPNTERAKHTQALLALVREEENMSKPGEVLQQLLRRLASVFYYSLHIVQKMGLYNQCNIMRLSAGDLKMQ